MRKQESGNSENEKSNAKNKNGAKNCGQSKHETERNCGK